MVPFLLFNKKSFYGLMGIRYEGSEQFGYMKYIKKDTIRGLVCHKFIIVDDETNSFMSRFWHHEILGYVGGMVHHVWDCPNIFVKKIVKRELGKKDEIIFEYKK
jgi:hypothetical protein